MMAGLLTIILLLGMSPCDAFFFDNDGDIFPVNPYVFIGDTLNLTCNLTNVASFPGNVSESLFFTTMFGEEERPLPSEYISIFDTRSIQLTYPITSGEDQEGYTCLLNRTSDKPVVVSNTRLTVEHRPIPATDILTVVNNWESMTITWSLGQDYVNSHLVNTSLGWTREYPTSRTDVYACPDWTKTSCTWKLNDGDDSLMMVQHWFYIQVETQRDTISRNQTANATEGWLTIKPEDLVKPAPVQNLNAEGRNSTCISLTWERSHNSENKKILCNLNIMPLEKIVSTTDTYITICGLQPARYYSFNVSCIPKSYGLEPRGYYSDTRVVEAVTNEDVPSGIPKMTANNFRYHDCHQTPHCTATIYWQSVSENERNGEIIAYQIKAIDATTDTTKKFTTLGSERSHDIVVYKDRDYRIEVKASTAIGSSERAAILILPARDIKLPYPSNFLVEKEDRDLYVSWTHPPETTPTGYTLYYCNGSMFTLTCVNDELNWVPLSANQNTSKLPMSDTNLDNQLVGISAESAKYNQNLTSGILWSLCTYVKDAKPAKPSNVHFSPEQPSNALRVNWNEAGCRMDAPYITQYLLTYCKGNTDGCSGPIVNQSIINTAQSHVIKDLPVGESYRVTLRARSSSGAGPESDPISRQVINNGLSTAGITGISVGITFFISVVLAVGVFGARRIYRCCTKKYPIEPPDSFLKINEPLPDKWSPITTTENNNNMTPPDTVSTDVTETTGGELSPSNLDQTGSTNLDSSGNVEARDDTESSLPSPGSSATSETTFFPENRVSKGLVLQVPLQMTCFSKTESTNPGYVSRIDSSEESSNAASYSKVASCSPSSPAGSDSSQTPLIPESIPSPVGNLQMNADYLPNNTSTEIVKETTCKAGPVQNNDYARVCR